MPTVESIMRQQKIRKNIVRAILIFFLIVFCIIIGRFIGLIGQKRDPVSYVNPHIESIHSVSWIHSPG